MARPPPCAIHFAGSRTQAELDAFLATLAGGPHPVTRHFEVETYTWSVLPAARSSRRLTHAVFQGSASSIQVGMANQCPTTQRTFKCSTGPSVEVITHRLSTSAGAAQSGQL